MTREDYIANPAVNFSSLKLILQSPAHYLAGRGEKDETLAMRMGTAVDEFVLEGKVRPYAIKPAHHPDDEKNEWRGNKIWCREWVRETKATGASIYSQAEWDKTSRMQRALQASEAFRDILECCPNRQTAYFATYRGVDLKALVDMDGHDNSGARAYGDLKTSNDGSPRRFGKKAFDLDYDLQIVLYGTVIAMSEKLEDKPRPFWVVAEESPANPVTVYAVPDEAWDSGQRKLDKCIDLLTLCREKEYWPAYGEGMVNLPWPKWATE